MKRIFEGRLHYMSKMDLLNENFILGELEFIIMRYLTDNQLKAYHYPYGASNASKGLWLSLEVLKYARL